LIQSIESIGKTINSAKLKTRGSSQTLGVSTHHSPGQRHYLAAGTALIITPSNKKDIKVKERGERKKTVARGRAFHTRQWLLRAARCPRRGEMSENLYHVKSRQTLKKEREMEKERGLWFTSANQTKVSRYSGSESVINAAT